MVSVEVSVELIDLFICNSSVGKAFAQLLKAEHPCDAVVTSEAPETVTPAARAAVIIPAGTAALHNHTCSSACCWLLLHGCCMLLLLAAAWWV